MEWYHILAIVSAALCFTAFFVQAISLYRLGISKDFSSRSGSIKKGVKYSFTKAMSPTQKESAYKHLPTYTAGILFHIGICITLLYLVWMFIAIFADVYLPEILGQISIIVLAISSLCGIAILLKRIIKKELRYISSPDDYISNILTTAAQIATLNYICVTLCPSSGNTSCIVTLYFITLSLLLLWMPFGKTKHLLYFFSARYHLGYFYGRRNSWPTNDSKK